MASPARNAHTETDLISLRSRDVKRRSRQTSSEALAGAEAPSSAWVSVDEGVDVNDIDDLSDDEVENEENEECDCAEQKQKSCCIPKGIGEIMARGFCDALNNVISCIRKNLTKKQIFMLLGAIVAAVCRTKNVAVSTADSEAGDETARDAASTVSEGSDVAADATGVVLKTLVDVVVDSYTDSDSVNATSVAPLEGTAVV